MGFRSAFSNGFWVGIRQWRITAIVYFIQLCLAFTLGMQVYEVLRASIGHSLEINQLLTHYDHTVLMDFLKVHGASITPLIGQLRWLLLTWMVFAVFIDGGLLYCAALPEPANGRAFWQGSAMHFFPFLKISLFFLVLFLIWTVAIWLPVALFFQPSLDYFSSEKYIVWLAGLALCVWLTGIGILLVWSVLSRLYHLRHGAGIASNLKNGFRIFRKAKVRFLSVLAGFTVLQLLLMGIYFHVEAITGFSGVGVLILFTVQQGFVFARIQLRQMVYGAIAAVGNTIKLKNIPSLD